MKSLLEILKLSTQYLEQKGISNPRRQAEEVIADALGLKRMELYLQYDRPLVETELELCRSRLARRAKGEPISYIRGEVNFLECSIKVNPNVLIPRQETEILTDKIIQEIKNENLEGKVLWDVCCGSGYIGIALKKHLPQLNVILSDISRPALELARENAKLNNVDVQCLEGDLLTPFKGQRTHYFICNPPYIAEHEFEHLDPEVRNFEPKIALISGPTGFEFYQRLALELPSHLNPHGKAWFEIGKGQGEPIQKIFSSFPWKTCRFEKDWAGHDRFFFLEME